MPTLFHAVEQQLREAIWSSKLWILSDTLVVASMNPVVRGSGHPALPVVSCPDTRSLA